jgi:hypothetical protein
MQTSVIDGGYRKSVSLSSTRAGGHAESMTYSEIPDDALPRIDSTTWRMDRKGQAPSLSERHAILASDTELISRTPQDRSDPQSIRSSQNEWSRSRMRSNWFTVQQLFTMQVHVLNGALEQAISPRYAGFPSRVAS